MAKNEANKSLADYVASVLSPMLIMALVGSLVFFLIKVLYVGEFEGRMQWILFFFVFGAVLIGRISMQGDISGRAGLYGLVMGTLVFIGLLIYVEYPADSPLASYGWAVNLGLIALIWWCTHRLTWDCTFDGDDADASGTGLLQAAGLETVPGQQTLPSDNTTSAQAGVGDGMPGDDEDPSLWQRYSRYREQKKKARTPGVWVVYFSLAALPIFGLGQAVIPVENEAARSHAWWMLAIYVGSGLGLLLTTCFIGLRRYLRQRNLRMPASMAAMWLMVGGILIAAMLAAGAVLPRPTADYPLTEWVSRVGSRSREASRYAQKGDSPGDSEGKASTDKPPPGKKAGESGGGNQKDQKGGSETQGKDKSGSGQSKEKQDSQGSSQKGEPGKDSQGGKKGEQSKEKSGQRSDQERSKEDSSRSKGDDRRDDQAKQAEQKSASRGGSSSRSNPPPVPPFEMLNRLSPVVKWIVYGLLGLAALYVFVRLGLAFLKHLANFSSWARQLLAALQAFWQKLFGWWERGAKAPDEAEEATERVNLRPFASYRNPFLDGRAKQLSPEQVVRYSFEALQAWAREGGMGRRPGDTPSEFIERIGQEVPALQTEAQRLGALYVRVAYARSRLSASAWEPLRLFWEQLTEVAERPLSAGASAE